MWQLIKRSFNIDYTLAGRAVAAAIVSGRAVPVETSEARCSFVFKGSAIDVQFNLHNHAVVTVDQNDEYFNKSDRKLIYKITKKWYKLNSAAADKSFKACRSKSQNSDTHKFLQ